MILDATADVELVVLRELLQVALPVGDEPDEEAVRPQRGDRGERIVVEGEVLVPLPLANHLGGARARAGGVAAHADDDPLGEGDPDLLVVNEPLSTLQLVDRVEPRLVVAGRIEPEPVPDANAPIPVTPATSLAKSRLEISDIPSPSLLLSPQQTVAAL